MDDLTVFLLVHAAEVLSPCARHPASISYLAFLVFYDSLRHTFLTEKNIKRKRVLHEQTHDVARPSILHFLSQWLHVRKSLWDKNKQRTAGCRKSTSLNRDKRAGTFRLARNFLRLLGQAKPF